jgi:hypothetical protein
MTTSTEDAPFGGDFNGDGYGDAVIVHKNATDNGANIHILYGAAGTPFLYPATYAQSLPASLWDYNKMKLAVGRFNTDAYSDLAIIDQRTDSGANVHVFYGSSGTPFQAATTQREMTAAEGWVWSQMKIVSGDFNGDGTDDLAIGAKRTDNGMGIHVLTGGANTAALNPSGSTSWRDLPGPGWLWDNMKLAAGPFNGDNNADLGLVYNDGGIDVHILNGGSAKFGNTSTSLRSDLPSPNWNWNLVKLAAGQFNDDVYADITMLHKMGDGGINAHPLYGSNGVPFQGDTSPIRTMPGSAGWRWDDIKVRAGPFNGDNWGDVAMLHRTGTSDTDVHVLYGNPGTQIFKYDPTITRDDLNTVPYGWNWYDMKP